MSKTKIYTTRGAGLGFFLAALIFVFTWSPAALLAVPLGAGAGYLLSRTGGVDRGLLDRWSGSPAGRVLTRLVSILAHPNLALRFSSLWALGFVLFLAAWTAGYYLLPEAVFRSAAEAQLESRGLGGAAENVTAEWWGIFRANLIPFVLIILANLVIRFNGIPLGYVTPLYNLALYGLFLGTNSFLIPYPERLAPTFAILGRAGPYEMTAFVLAAAATARWSFYQVRRLFRTNPERVPGGPQIKWPEIAALILAAGVLAAAAWVEAGMVVAAG